MPSLGKVWGKTELLLPGSLIEIHRLTIKPNAQCSLHLHRFKWNAFLVITGRLFIDVHQRCYKLVDTTALGPGELTTVKPNLYHLFRTEEAACLAIELYYPELLSEDIVRKTVGKITRRSR